MLLETVTPECLAHNHFTVEAVVLQSVTYIMVNYRCNLRNEKNMTGVKEQK